MSNPTFEVLQVSQFLNHQKTAMLITVNVRTRDSWNLWPYCQQGDSMPLISTKDSNAYNRQHKNAWQLQPVTLPPTRWLHATDFYERTDYGTTASPNHRPDIQSSLATIIWDHFCLRYDLPDGYVDLHKTTLKITAQVHRKNFRFRLHVFKRKKIKSRMRANRLLPPVLVWGTWNQIKTLFDSWNRNQNWFFFQRTGPETGL
jgi:hypothetical protein